MSDTRGKVFVLEASDGGHLDTAGRKLYWADREGMRVMRRDLDGDNIKTLVRTGRGDDDRRDQTRWCVGIAVDPDGGTDGPR